MDQAVALMDWDNTLRPGFTILDWAQFLAKRNLFDRRIAEELSATVEGYRNGTVTYRELSDGAPKLYGLGLQGFSVQAVTENAAEFADGEMSSLFPFVGPLHEFLHRRSIACVVISGAPEEILEAYKNIFGWHDVFGVSVAAADGRYLATLASNPAGAAAKEAIVREFRGGRESLLAFGDSEADVPLLRAASWRVVVDSDDLAGDLENVIRIQSTTSPEILIDKLESNLYPE